MEKYNPADWWENPDFEKSMNFAKVYVKKSKAGVVYFEGRVGNTMFIQIWKGTGQYSKEGEYQVKLMPVKRTRKENKQEKLVNPEQLEAMSINPKDEVPF